MNIPNFDEDIVFETFAHKSGKSHYCLQANGQRYFLDSSKTGQWQPFPNEWLNDGQFIRDDSANVYKPPKERRESSISKHEDEVEFLNIPGKGKVQAQLFENRVRIHCYYDPQEATWIKLPLSWELFSASAKEIVQLVQDVCPDWSDEKDILGLLRACNYNVDECVNAYHCTYGKVGQPSTSANFIPTNSPQPTSFSSTTPRQEPTPQITPISAPVVEEQIAELLDTLKDMTERVVSLEQELVAEKEMHKRVKKQLENERQKCAISRSEASKKNKVADTLVQSLGDIRTICQEMRTVVKPTSFIFKKPTHTIERALTKYKQLGSKNYSRVNEIKALYRKEVEQRRHLYNTLIEIRGNIRVFCRIRPSIETEPSPLGSDSDMLVPMADGNLAARLPNSTQRNYQFDRIFQTTSKQEEIFEELRDVITSVIDGYNVCIVAYGQTGSGKTFTMQGPSENPGVNKRALRELLNVMASRHRVEYNLSVSMVEIYNENIVDLISPSNACEQLELRNLGTTVTVMGATWENVKTENEIQELLSRGEKNRHVASTKMNSTSSRSHLVVSVNAIGSDAVSGTVSRGCLILCDLAGSERAEIAGVTKGERFVESTHINMSLSALGQVFSALRNNQLHVPYRNSKLTQILQPCLGGDAKACLIVNVSSEPKSLLETLSTLLFGANARQVALGPAKAHVSKII